MSLDKAILSLSIPPRYHPDGSGIFLWDTSGSCNLHMKSDRGWEVLGKHGRDIIYDGYGLVIDLLGRPINDIETLGKRQDALERLAHVDENQFEKLASDSRIMRYLFHLIISEDLSIREFIQYCQQLTDLIQSKTPKDPNWAWSTGLQFDTVDSIWRMIPAHIADIRWIGGDFFSAIAQELENVSWPISHFPVREVFSLTQKINRVASLKMKLTEYQSEYEHQRKRLNTIESWYYHELTDIFSKYKNWMQSFVEIYVVIDACMILSTLLRNDHLRPWSISNEKESWEKIVDGRLYIRALRWENHDDFQFWEITLPDGSTYTPNDLWEQDFQHEFYVWPNGGGKSAWLKSRLMLQLYQQAFLCVPGENISLPLRSGIHFMNRSWSGYSENLSAFGRDITELQTLLSGRLDNALVFCDELGSTIPEGEAYALLRWILEFLHEKGAKTIFSLHNEQFIRAIEAGAIPDSKIWHFPMTIAPDGSISYPRIKQSGSDIAHTLSVFRAAGFDSDTLARAGIAMNPDLQLLCLKSTQLVPRDVRRYTPEERESLKNEQWRWFRGLSRSIDVISIPGGHESYDRWYTLSARLPVDNRSPRYDTFPSFSIAEYESTIDDWMRHGNTEDATPSQFQLLGMHDAKWVRFPHELFWDERLGDEFHYCKKTLKWVLTHGLTSDTRELYERQQFFSELNQIDAHAVNMLYDSIDRFSHTVRRFHQPQKTRKNFHSTGLNCDVQELQYFNQALWKKILDWSRNIDYLPALKCAAIIRCIEQLLEIEKILGNIESSSQQTYAPLLTRLKRYTNLLTRLERSERHFRYKQRSKESTSHDHIEKITQKLKNLLRDEFSEWEDTFLWLIQEVEDAVSALKPYNILTISEKKRSRIVAILQDGDMCYYHDDPLHKTSRSNIFDGDSDLYAFIWVILWTAWEGTMLDPFLAQLRSLDSVHAHQIATYIESMILLPTATEWRDRLKRRIRDPLFLTDLSSWHNPRYEKEKKYILPQMFESDRGSFHPVSVMSEICGLVRIANRIHDLGWKKVTYNTTGDIEIRGMSHAGKKSLPRNQQTLNDFSLKNTQHFDILEWATMGGKTMHLQSVLWVMRYAHSLGYAPVESANIPLFDGIVYLDRILEDESKKLSAGQKDAHYWKTLLDQVMGEVTDITKNGGRYWWAIDEMISSVPSRYQRWLVIAIIEKLKSLGQRWQISIHNPYFVSRILALDPESYTVHHPEVQETPEGDIISTHRIIPWRSIDRDGNFSAFSLETASSLWLNPDIIARAKKYRKQAFSGY